MSSHDRGFPFIPSMDEKHTLLLPHHDSCQIAMIDVNRRGYQTACLEPEIMLCQDGSHADLMAVEVSEL